MQTRGRRKAAGGRGVQPITIPVCGSVIRKREGAANRSTQRWPPATASGSTSPPTGRSAPPSRSTSSPPAPVPASASTPARSGSTPARCSGPQERRTLHPGSRVRRALRRRHRPAARTQPQLPGRSRLRRRRPTSPGTSFRFWKRRAHGRRTRGGASDGAAPPVFRAPLARGESPPGRYHSTRFEDTRYSPFVRHYWLRIQFLGLGL